MRFVSHLVILAGSLLPLSAADVDNLPSSDSATSPALAHAGSLTPAVLTLEETLRRADRNSSNTAVARARIERAQALERQAWTLVKPSVTLNGSWGTNHSSWTPYGYSSVQSVGGDATVAVTFFDLSALPGIDGARQQVDQSLRSGRDLRRQLAFSAANAYLEVLAAEQLDGVSRRRVEVTTRLRDEAKARQQNGLAVLSDVSRADSEVASAELSLTQTRRNIAATRWQLVEVIGGGEAPGSLTFPVSARLPEGPADELITAALQRRDDVQAAVLGLAVNRASQQQAKNGFWPTLGAKAGVSEVDTNNNSRADDPAWTAALTAQWKLYDGGLREGQAEERAALGREQAAQLAALKLTVATQVRTAQYDIEATETAVRQADTAYRSAETNVRELNARYGSGLATSSEVADAVLRAVEAATNRERAVVNHLKARLNFRQAVGYWPLGNGFALPADPTAKP
jgi:outer membrane protein TolC